MSVPLRLRARFGADVPTPPAEPVTVTVARVVRPDQREAFERWAEDVLEVAAGFAGNLGASLLHPGPNSSEYHLVYRFEDDASLAAWERSPERRSALAHVEEMVDDARYARVAGLESFFTRSATPGPRWRLTLLTVAAVFAITSLLQQFVMPHLGSWPLELRLLLSAVVVVLLLSQVLMPALTRLFARWLHPARD
ncbi:antibiotic biosynthesis monooxygenase [Blastococcus sp. CT_GayMR16]|uniref:antibiotic biosynthesis monooxygenase n=1 Tax=Blastococcus sp. CT_GayMR16 TaxID=2559607 RepID=UPI0010746470|nr:antibiotic biosynthesis monooxygenase [Blastococcus sp. CT_GayMR16]TFV86851.1 antibiotic biosynthesis monooxygenase [Blastococcus sp. CT_GayMR16]